MIASNYKALVRAVEPLCSKPWHEGGNEEWTIVDYMEGELGVNCVCGHTDLHHAYTLKNTINGNVLEYIGSDCIDKFNFKELRTEKNVLNQEYALAKAVKNNDFITLKDNFSRVLLEKLFDEGCFGDNQYNDYDGTNDYEFIVKMFNKRTDPTEKQTKKIKGLIYYTIIPFVKKHYAGWIEN